MSRKRWTILIVGPSAPPYNGMTRAIELIVAALNDHLSVVHLDTADRRGLSNIGRFELGNLLLAAKHGLTFLWQLLSNRPRIVYIPVSQSWLPFLRDCLFLIPAKLFRRRVVIHLHGGCFGRFYRETSPIMRSIIRYAIGSAFCAIVLGKSVADAFDGILPRERIRIVPNGIPDDFAEREIIQSVEPEGRGPVVLYLSTLAAEKGFLDLLQVLPKVMERVGGVRAVFAGEWYSQQDRDAANQLVDSFGLRNVAEFVGAVGTERKGHLLEGADIFVFPSKNEGHPYVILESMAAGLPIVSTNVACIPETVRDGVEGFLIDPGDLEALADRIECLLVDKSLCNRMGHASRQRFLEEFTYERFAERIKSVFNEVTHGIQ
jgi:glycosyltransferase involved in cell wall biosynthesis